MKKQVDKNTIDKKISHQNPHEHILDKTGRPKLGKESITKKIKQHDSGGLA